MSALRKGKEPLAERYETLRLKASWEIDNSLAGEVKAKLLEEQREAASQIKKCVREIRKVPSHERFQKALEIKELRALVVNRAIVLVNISSIRANATILTGDGATALHLLDLKPEKASPAIV